MSLSGEKARPASPKKMLDQESLDILFNEARSHNGWLPREIPEGLLEKVYDLAKMGPTSANSQPMRVVFAKSTEAKEKLAALAIESNRAKILTAPVVAIIGMDMEFYNNLPRFFPHTDAKSWFVGNEELIAATAFRNSSLQGAYLMLAARALGLDCGPMSGFDNAGVDAAFFAGTKIKSNFICGLGYGDHSKIFARSPRPAFGEFCKVV